jgi:hypothetical protein
MLIVITQSVTFSYYMQNVVILIHYAEYHFLSVIMLIAIMLSAIMLSASML